MIGENRPMTFSYHIDYKLGSTVKTATGSNEDLLLQVRESDHRLQVTLHPTAPIQVRSFILELPFLFTPASRFMANGFQSWTDSREFGPTERMPGLGTVGKSPIGRRLGMQYTGDYTFVPEEKQAGVFHSHGFAYVRTGDMLDFIGSMTDRTGFTVITADMNRNVLAVSKDLEGLMLTEDYPVLDLYMQQGHYDAVFDGYFAALAYTPAKRKSCGAIPPGTTITAISITISSCTTCGPLLPAPGSIPSRWTTATRPPWATGCLWTARSFPSVCAGWPMRFISAG